MKVFVFYVHSFHHLPSSGMRDSLYGWLCALMLGIGQMCLYTGMPFHFHIHNIRKVSATVGLKKLLKPLKRVGRIYSTGLRKASTCVLVPQALTLLHSSSSPYFTQLPIESREESTHTRDISGSVVIDRSICDRFPFQLSSLLVSVHVRESVRPVGARNGRIKSEWKF